MSAIADVVIWEEFISTSLLSCVKDTVLGVADREFEVLRKGSILRLAVT